MADFTQNSKFDASKNYAGVEFGADAPLLEVELNEMQDIQNHARAEILRQSIHSGVLTHGSSLGNIGIGVASTTHPLGSYSTPFVSNFSYAQNQFALVKNKVNINGFLLETSSSMLVTLPEPPTEGARDDLVFLEAWFEEVDFTKDASIKDSRIGAETSRRRKLNWRVRTVAGVDFNVFGSDGFSVSGAWIGWALSVNPNVTAQGGSASPLSPTTDSRVAFVSPPHRLANGRPLSNDMGLYVAGDGTQAAKDELKTADGFVYALPLFRVKRRNSGGYSANNGNGATNCLAELFVNTGITIQPGDIVQVQANPTKYSEINVGDKFFHPVSKSYEITVLSKDGNNLVTIKHTGTSASLKTIELMYKASDRPDELYANIIDARDIIDLRHKVSLTGVDYDNLLEESLNKLVQGNLQTKDNKKMLKTYHGVRKTPIDSDHVFYASFDGTKTPELGSVTSFTSDYAYKPNTTGLGVSPKDVMQSESVYEFASPVNASNGYTVEMFIANEDYSAVNGYDYFGLSFSSATHETTPRSDACAISLYKAPSSDIYTLVVKDKDGLNIPSSFIVSKKITQKPYHLRVTVRENSVSLYINGKLIGTRSVEVLLADVNRYVIGGPNGTTWGNYLKLCTYSDVSVSKIDRGANFATLPKDFIDGYAKIMPAFHDQRKNFSDAQMSQLTTSVVKATGTRPKHISTTQATAGVWAAGDTIKVKSLSGGVISGAIDADTALARITTYVTGVNPVVTVDDVSKLAVNDTVSIRSEDLGQAAYATTTILAVDAVNKKVTLDSLGASWAIGASWYLVETTASSSSPVVTATGIAGTWSGLGTAEATYTLTTAPTTNNADVKISYSVNYPAGQGALTDVLDATLAGEANGKKLVRGVIAVTDDFAGKVSGSVTENPSIIKGLSFESNTLQPPSGTWSELISTSAYVVLSKLDGSLFKDGHTNNGNVVQNLFSFNVVEILERKYPGIFNDCLNLADKVDKSKKVLGRITANWYGFGSGPGGSKSYFRAWWNSANQWSGSPSNNTGSVSKLSISLISDIPLFITNDGFVHYIAYTDPSDGVSYSTINTDYINLELEIVSKTGYDTLVPENPRRDAGAANVLYVRKETREVEVLVNAEEDSGIVTYGDYTPYQGLSNVRTKDKGIGNRKTFITTAGTAGTRAISSFNSYTEDIHPLQHLPIDNSPADFVPKNIIVDGKVRDSFVKFGEMGVLRSFYGIHFNDSAFFSHENEAPAKYQGAVSAVNATEVFTVRTPDSDFTSNFLTGEYHLALIDGELHLVVATLKNSGAYVNRHAFDVFKLEGRPLIKGVN